MIRLLHGSIVEVLRRDDTVGAGTGGSSIPISGALGMIQGMTSRDAVRQEIRFCTAEDGIRLAYAAIGRGPPLVKAANWLTHIEHDVRSPLRRPLLERLSTGRRLIRYDQRACGLSDWDVPDISFAKWTADLQAVTESAGLRREELEHESGGIQLAVRGAKPFLGKWISAARPGMTAAFQAVQYNLGIVRA